MTFAWTRHIPKDENRRLVLVYIFEFDDGNKSYIQ